MTKKKEECKFFIFFLLEYFVNYTVKAHYVGTLSFCKVEVTVFKIKKYDGINSFMKVINELSTYYF